MPSIKFTEAELEFLVGQYELELIEAEKYIGEIKNILKKLGVVYHEVSEKQEKTGKRGRGRPAKAKVKETKLPQPEKEVTEKKKGKRGRPKKKGSKALVKSVVKSQPKALESKTDIAKAEVKKAAAVKAVKKAKPSKEKKPVVKVKPAPKKEK